MVRASMHSVLFLDEILSMGGHETLTYTKVSCVQKWRWGRNLLNYIGSLIFLVPSYRLSLTSVLQVLDGVLCCAVLYNEPN